MSDRITQLVDTIREKSILLKDQVASEKAKNEELTQEIHTLKQEVSSRDGKVDELNNKITDLNDGLKAAKEQSITGSEGNEVSQGQIDELVKEIEYCIEQLKK
ncbi:MAG: hypothetical protein HRT57_14095 [Crocinitomicaceae bacterium]|nr:hypothetical protein [Crocinitomicaceae bacterium]